MAKEANGRCNGNVMHVAVRWLNAWSVWTASIVVCCVIYNILFDKTHNNPVLFTMASFYLWFHCRMKHIKFPHEKYSVHCSRYSSIEYYMLWTSGAILPFGTPHTSKYGLTRLSDYNHSMHRICVLQIQVFFSTIFGACRAIAADIRIKSKAVRC